MKKKSISVTAGLLYLLTIFVLSVFPAKLLSQNNAVRWSTFDVGFGMSASANTIVKSSIGQGFVGIIEQGNTRIESGFFADSSMRRTIISSVRVQQACISYLLMQNYPNPFNPSTTIRYALPNDSKVKLSIYDLLGREIATLVNEEQSAGWKEVKWNASQYSSGMYLYRIKSGNFVLTKKLILLR